MRFAQRQADSLNFPLSAPLVHHDPMPDMIADPPRHSQAGGFKAAPGTSRWHPALPVCRLMHVNPAGRKPATMACPTYHKEQTMYQRILVPVDGSEGSNKALVAALQLARESDGRVRLIHVMEQVDYLTAFEQFGGYSGGLALAIQEAATKVLDGAMAIARSSGTEADSQLYDKPGERLAEVVAEAAKEWNADLVVVGTHGRRGFGRMLLGSGAEQILRLSPLPVLVIR